MQRPFDELIKEFFDKNNPPKIKVIFRGFVVTRIQPDAGDEAIIGAIKGSTCHRPIIHIYRIDANDVTTEVPPKGKLDLRSDFTLYVHGKASTKVPSDFQTLVKDGNAFNRLDEENDPKDFNWFTNFDQIHDSDTKVRLNLEKLGPKFHLNRGCFYSSGLSGEEVKLTRDKEKFSQRFGRHAIEISAKIDLSPTEIAYFKNGANEIIDPITPKSDRYEIVVDCTCRSADEGNSDFHLVYDYQILVTDDQKAGSIPKDRQARFELRFKGKNPTDKTPDSYCTGGNGH